MFSFLSRKKADPKACLREVLGEYELPSFPGVTTEVMQQIRDPTIAQTHSVYSVRVFVSAALSRLRVFTPRYYRPNPQLRPEGYPIVARAV